MKIIAPLLAVLSLTGCATAEYAAYADAHKAQAAAQTARYQALADIAKQGDTTAKVAAVSAMLVENRLLWVCVSLTMLLLWLSAPTKHLSAWPRRFKRQQPT